MIPAAAVEAAWRARSIADMGRNEVWALLEAAAPYMIVTVHHHDIEHHARSFNEGYQTAVAQGLADDPSKAQDWLDAKLAAAWDEGYAAGDLPCETAIPCGDCATCNAPQPVNPYRPTP